MSDRALIVAAFIIGGAIVASAFSTSARYSLSAAGNNIAWRMDTWSGSVDICAAAYMPRPVVRCGAVIVAPLPSPTPDSGPTEPGPTQSAPPFDIPKDRANY